MTMASSCIAGLLLLLAAAAAGLATPVEYQYHSYAVTPLSPHTYSVPAADDDGARARQEDVAVSPSALHVRLLHRDSFAVNATPAQLLARRLQRDELRAAWIIKAAAPAANDTPVVGLSSGGAFVAPVVSRAPTTSGEYMAKIAVGTPAVEALLAMDTGSDITWLQCQPCRRCYPQSGPVFDPRHSTSYREMGYDAPDCQALGRSGGGGGDAKRMTCVYAVGYGDDGSTTVGDFIEETLTFAGGVQVPHMSIGCGHDNKGLFAAPAAGILGLGRGQISCPSQIAALGYNVTSFSYCLADFFLSSPGRSVSSTLTIGDGAAAGSPPPSFTPTVQNLNMATFYYVRLVGVSVGGVRVPGVTEDDLKLDPYTGRGGVILDSGTAVTRLARRAYIAFRDAFRAAAVDLGQVSIGGPSGFFDTCYTMGGRAMKVPTVSMHFAGGVELTLPPKNYLIPVDSMGTVCFAFAGTGDRSVSIIGNIQQQGFRVVYNIGGGRVGFAPNSC